MRSKLFVFFALIAILSGCQSSCSKSGKRVEIEESAPHYKTIISGIGYSGGEVTVLKAKIPAGNFNYRTGMVDTILVSARIHTALQRQMKSNGVKLFSGDSITIITIGDMTTDEGEALVVGFNLPHGEISVR